MFCHIAKSIFEGIFFPSMNSSFAIFGFSFLLQICLELLNMSHVIHLLTSKQAWRIKWISTVGLILNSKSVILFISCINGFVYNNPFISRCAEKHVSFLSKLNFLKLPYVGRIRLIKFVKVWRILLWNCISLKYLIIISFVITIFLTYFF